MTPLHLTEPWRTFVILIVLGVVVYFLEKIPMREPFGFKIALRIVAIVVALIIVVNFLRFALL